jgi:hypothetical protein
MPDVSDEMQPGPYGKVTAAVIAAGSRSSSASPGRCVPENYAWHRVVGRGPPRRTPRLRSCVYEMLVMLLVSRLRRELACVVGAPTLRRQTRSLSGAAHSSNERISLRGGFALVGTPLLP